MAFFLWKVSGFHLLWCLLVDNRLYWTLSPYVNNWSDLKEPVSTSILWIIAQVIIALKVQTLQNKFQSFSKHYLAEYSHTVEGIHWPVHPNSGYIHLSCQDTETKKCLYFINISRLQSLYHFLLCRLSALAVMHHWGYVFLSWTMFSITSLEKYSLKNHKVWHLVV